MSHFATLVLLSKEQKGDVEGSVEKLLAKYDENMDVPEYDRPCHCLGVDAKNNAVTSAVLKFGTIESLRNSFAALRDWSTATEEEAQEAWSKHIGEFDRHMKAAFEADPDREKPKANCSECKGNGTYRSTYNNDSKWDWYVIGGRWSNGLGGKNIRPVSKLPADIITFAVVTPNGEWHEQAKMGLWGITRDDKPANEWEAEFKGLMEKHKDCTAVLIDCHI